MKDLGNPHKSNMINVAEFGGAQFLDIVLQKWFSMDPNFQTLESEEGNESKENSPTEVKKRFATRPRCIITRCTYGYGGKSKSSATNG